MKILHLNYHAAGGGAAIAARRLHVELMRRGIDSQMWVIDAAGSKVPNIREAGRRSRLFCGALQRLERLLLRLDGDSRTCMPRALNLFRTGLTTRIRAENPDLVHLHWINGGMIGVSELPMITSPVVWTLHDGWPLCGAEHCHATGDERFRLGYRTGSDFWNIWNWKRKRHHWRDWNFRSVAPSTWLFREATASILLARSQPVCIPNGVDLKLFSPGDRQAARRALGLSERGRFILFGAASATDPNKGGPEFLEALRHLAAQRDFQDVSLLWLGSGKCPEHVPFPVVRLGFVAEERILADCYRAADLFVLASKYDNLPNMLVEATACGTPLAAFDVGGIPDIVIPGVNGFLAPPFKAAKLAEAMAAVLNTPSKTLHYGARAHAEAHFDIRRCADRYLAFYQERISERARET